MSYCVILLLALLCLLTSGFEHHFTYSSNPSYGHTDEELSSEDQARRVHPHFNPHSKEKPLLTICCDLQSFKGVRREILEQQKDPMVIRRKCFLEIGKTFSEKVKLEFGDDYASTMIYNMDRNMSVCLLECISRELGVTNSDGSINLDEALRINRLSSRKKMGVTDLLVKRCVLNANEIGRIESEQKHLLCSMATVEFEQCMLEYIDLFCPEESQIKGYMCNRYRQRLFKKFVDDDEDI